MAFGWFRMAHQKLRANSWDLDSNACAPWRGHTMDGRGAGVGNVFGTTLYTDGFSRIPTQEGSIGLKSNTFRTLGQSRTAGGMGFDSMFPKCEAA